MNVGVMMDCHPDLPHVVDALRAPRSGPGRLHRGQKQAHEHGNDGYHHEQLDKRKCST
jgi:hypothetical protein